MSYKKYESIKSLLISLLFLSPVAMILNLLFGITVLFISLMGLGIVEWFYAKNNSCD